MSDEKSAWPHATLDKRKKQNLYIIEADLSTFSIKDNLSVFWTVNLCQLRICTGDYTMWLSKLRLFATCRYNKEESVCMHVMNVCEYACERPVHVLIHHSLERISTSSLFFLFFSMSFKNPLHGLCSSVLRPCFPHVNVCGLSQLHSLPKLKWLQ